MNDMLGWQLQDTGCGVSGTLMRTVSGRCVDPLNFTADDVFISDIAHALAFQCRYNGHSVGHLSVARHCLWVSNQLQSTLHPELMLTGLLHDAAEAYTGDLIRPLKHRPELASFLEIEHAIELVICDVFDIDLFNPLVKEADVWVLMNIEQQARLEYNGDAHSDELAFLDRFHELTRSA